MENMCEVKFLLEGL